MSAGRHSLKLIPIQYISKDVDTSFSLEVPVIGASASWDWKTLGIDPKDILEGVQSDLTEFNYTPSTIYKAKPEIKGVETDFNDNVIITFNDLYDSDAYRIYITHGKNDERYYDYDVHSDESAAYITKSKSTVSIILDQEYLQSKRWLVPELDEKYSFSVQLAQNPINLINEEPIQQSPQYSQNSSKEDYTPISRWKLAPTITRSSQDGNGSVIINWEHDDNGLGCSYKIIKQDKLLVVKKGEAEIGVTPEKEYEIIDLVNGKYTFAVVPVLDNEEGLASDPITIEVKADWVTAPALECNITEKNHITLKWDTADKVENYHIIVSAGSGSLLRFVNLDYKKIAEFDVPSENTTMEYDYEYPDEIDLETGVKLKFEIFGIRHAADGTEQHSSTSKQEITLK